ncbi:hypothetical protein C1645_833376 [Glomus cerebriforme]|uniref:Uncharacterized protein n=1 Tax=Glomus cerebriforme TaxID=658196 RepID=A0A397SLN1_9GLOM|nr:hypothetical protein C1645_833376 [Glomus cerebriforme]
MESIISDSLDNQNTREARRCRKESHVWDHFIKKLLALYCRKVPLPIKTEYMEMLAIGTTSTNRRQKSDTADSSAELNADRKDKSIINLILCLL